MDFEIYELIEKALNSYNNSKELAKIYGKLEIVLKELPKRELANIKSTVKYSKQSCLVLNANKYGQLDKEKEGAKRIEVYDRILSLIAQAMKADKKRTKHIEKIDDAELSF